MLRRRRDWAFQTNTDKDDGGGMEMGSTQSDDDSNDGDGSECDSKDDEGGGTDQLIYTFRLEVESDIEKKTTLMMIHCRYYMIRMHFSIPKSIGSLVEMLMKVYFTCKVTLTSTLA